MELLVESRCQHVTWKVHDFFQLPSEIGYFLDSPEFRFAEDKYSLRLYPKRNQEGVTTEIHLVRLSYTFPERIVSFKGGFRYINGKDEIDVDFILSYKNNCMVLRRSWLEADRYRYVPGGTFTLLCSLRLREQSSGRSSQSEEAKTSETKEEQDGLPGQSVFFSSRRRSSKMELSTESPYQYVTWKVPEFFQLLSKIGSSLNSPEFRFADDRYCLRFYPKVNRNGDTDDYDLQLVRLTSTLPENIVSYKVGYKKRTATGCEIYMYLYSVTLTDDLGLCLSRTQLEENRNRFVPDGTFTVICSMRLGDQSSKISRQSEELGTSVAEEKQGELPDVAKMQSDYRRLLQTGAESDMCFVVSGIKFRAHRCVLRARSTVFEAMFEHETSEKESGRVVIDDLEPESFGEFLEYLYTGALEAGFSDDNTFGLYTAADKYDVTTLKSKCVAHLCKTLTVDSFCDTMALALRHRENDLLQQAIQFFKKNLERIIVTAKWQQFATDNSTSANELFIKALVPRGQ